MKQLVLLQHNPSVNREHSLHLEHSISVVRQAELLHNHRIPTKFSGKVNYENIKIIKYENPATPEATYITLSRNGVIQILDDNNRLVSKYDVPYGAHVLVKNAENVEKNQVLYEWDPYNSVIVAEHNGIVNYIDLEENTSYAEAPDETNRTHSEGRYRIKE